MKMHHTLIASVVGIILLLSGAYLLFSQTPVPPSDSSRMRTEIPSTPLSDTTSNAAVFDTEVEETTPMKETGMEEEKREETDTPQKPEPVQPTVPEPIQSTIIEPVQLTVPKPVLPKGYSLSDVRLHGDVSSCWTIIRGSVYDLTSFVEKHPGGDRKILSICGKDGTESFEGQHGGNSQPESTLARYRLGAFIE